MGCYLCGAADFEPREGKVRDKPELSILECRGCGLVFLADQSDRDTSFYAESGMHGASSLDVQSWLRETDKDDQRRFELLADKLVGRRVLDFGCGVGGFLLKAKERAASVHGVEPEKRLAAHFLQHGVTVWPDCEGVDPANRFEIITAFHVLEHLPDPRDALRKLGGLLADASSEIIVEVPSSSDALLMLYRNRAFSEFTYWSCHLYLFDAANLALLARQAGLRVNFVRQIQRYPLSNHLHWLSRGKPGGHQVWSFLDTPDLARSYEAALAANGLCDTLIASFSHA